MSNKFHVICVAVSIALSFFSVNSQAKKWDMISYEQTLEIKKGKASSYVSASGEKFNVGQVIILRAPANGHQRYTYAFTRAALAQPFPLSSAWNGARLKIDKIWWKQVQGVPNVVLHTSAEGANFGAGKQMIANLEAALDMGEVVTNMEQMKPVTEKTPLEKLKEAKELLDLKVISQEEYDQIKEKLIPLILEN